MAIWQFDVNLLQTRPINVDEISRRCSSILPRATGWLSNQSVWGHEDGNRLVLLEDDDSTEIEVRFDLRSPSKKFAHAVVSLANDFAFKLVNSDGREIKGGITELAHDMMLSDAFRFVSDPKVFLEQMENEKEYEE